ncbi:hypothetical protein [Burkholderia cenocepacia]|uniref:hypothetical protein n=1 Tax=Burkholderia cenocepacia TaxID=95486 RepID=UPI00264BCB8C|nr:hypothetical protein [Burkholderia cenocepacia]MDN7631397.1 hypothetical protein [Burkholderia cenocepacia]
MDDQWTIVPNPTKGHTISVAWLHSSLMSDEDWQLCIDVFISYVRTKSASTAYGVVGNTKDHLVHGIPNLTLLTGKWSGIPTHQKKSLNQFFGTLCSLGHKRFNDYHAFTRTHLNKEKRGNLDPETGSMTDFEFDSLAKLINTSLGAVDWSLQRNLAFYRSTTFSHVRTAVANKLMLAIVRRPIQLALLKWCDLIPAGASFKDKNIRSLNEMGTLGSRTLQLRVFHAKEKGTSHHRSHPERYPIPLSEELSESLLQYKRFCLEGLKLLLEESGLAIDEHDLISIVPNVPIFPHLDMFKCEANSLDFFRDAFTEASSLFHAGDQALTMDLRRIPSDRAPSCKASNNRIRHTVLTRGAQGGLPAVQLARITGVTVPAARHYVDMDYDSRRLIDANYVGNEFLRRAFSNSVSPALEGEEEILGHDFNEIGGARVAQTCRSCKTELGKPIGCYGCPNFRPILEANHRAELQIADDKLSANRAFLFNPLEINSIRKIEIQIKWINLTIEVCDEILARRRGIDAQQIS